MNNKGMIELIIFAVVGIIAVALFAAFIYGFGLINNTLSSGEMDTSYVNLTKASENTFAYLNSAMDRLKMISAVIIIGFMIATLIFSFAAYKHPLWLFPYVLILVMVTIFSVYISNSYETLTQNEVLGSTISGFGISGFIMAKLPVWVVAIGMIGIMLSIVGITIGRKFTE